MSGGRLSVSIAEQSLAVVADFVAVADECLHGRADEAADPSCVDS
jgi:hypothetical protein